MDEKYAIIGLGQFGFAVAKNLAERGAQVLAIDKDMDRVELIKDHVAYAVAMDATDIKALRSQHLDEMDAVLVAIGENIEGLLLSTVQLLELKTKRIMARAMTEQQRRILEKLGVKEILSPEDEVGKLVAELLLNPNMKAFLPLPDEYSIVEIKAPRRIVNHSLLELRLMENYDLDLITIKRQYEEIEGKEKVIREHLVIRPPKETMVEHSDILIVMGKSYDVEKFVDLNR